MLKKSGTVQHTDAGMAHFVGMTVLKALRTIIRDVEAIPGEALEAYVVAPSIDNGRSTRAEGCGSSKSATSLVPHQCPTVKISLQVCVQPAAALPCPIRFLSPCPPAEASKAVARACMHMCTTFQGRRRSRSWQAAQLAQVCAGHQITLCKSHTMVADARCARTLTVHFAISRQS